MRVKEHLEGQTQLSQTQEETKIKEEKQGIGRERVVGGG